MTTTFVQSQTPAQRKWKKAAQHLPHRSLPCERDETPLLWLHSSSCTTAFMTKLLHLYHKSALKKKKQGWTLSRRERSAGPSVFPTLGVGDNNRGDLDSSLRSAPAQWQMAEEGMQGRWAPSLAPPWLRSWPQVLLQPHYWLEHWIRPHQTCLIPAREKKKGMIWLVRCECRMEHGDGASSSQHSPGNARRRYPCRRKRLR